MAQETAQDYEVLTDLPGINNDLSININKGLVSDSFHVTPLNYPEFSQMVWMDEEDVTGPGFKSLFHPPLFSEMRSKFGAFFKMYQQKRAFVRVRAHIVSNIGMIGQLAMYWTAGDNMAFNPDRTGVNNTARYISCLPPSQVVWADLGGSFVMEIDLPWLIPKNCMDQTDETGEPYTDSQLNLMYPFPTVNLASVGLVYSPAEFSQWSIRWSEQWFLETGAPTMSESTKYLPT